ncbi:putative fam18-like protein [Monocercomonoides exilis]|uniref:putative fam18-like protein n=1 Tax=Monocercomonoides exilis TaxID=2049356 RepID=UPI003559392B|nr:putative fam18-like protein [Monocercomonoides exilis]
MDFTPLVQQHHPIVWALTFAFKGLAIVLYILAGILNFGFVTAFVIIILLLACDFWMVKNISGRMLVGYRWWNDILEDGQSVWRFETIRDRSLVPKFSTTLFWGTLWVYPAVWSILALVAIIKLNFGWLLIDIAGIMLAGTNLLGYIKCSRQDPRQAFKKLVTQATVTAATNALNQQMGISPEAGQSSNNSLSFPFSLMSQGTSELQTSNQTPTQQQSLSSSELSQA